ncbi:MAG: hypothetical protein RLZZ99_790, partial [Actinomycetota bacterium]
LEGTRRARLRRGLSVHDCEHDRCLRDPDQPAASVGCRCAEELERPPQSQVVGQGGPVDPRRAAAVAGGELGRAEDHGVHQCDEQAEALRVQEHLPARAAGWRGRGPGGRGSVPRGDGADQEGCANPLQFPGSGPDHHAAQRGDFGGQEP